MAPIAQLYDLSGQRAIVTGAGSAHPLMPALEIREEQRFDRNLKGGFFLSQKTARVMIAVGNSCRRLLKEPVSSLISAFQSLLVGNRLDVVRLAEREVAVWRRGAELLAQMPDANTNADADAARRIDIHLRTFQADPMRTVHDIYDRLGLVLSVDAEQAMRTHLAKAQAASRPPHRYTLEAFGLDAQRIHKQFSPYIERFNVLG